MKYIILYGLYLFLCLPLLFMIGDEHFTYNINQDSYCTHKILWVIVSLKLLDIIVTIKDKLRLRQHDMTFSINSY